MSKILIIRHLPSALPLQDKEKLLKHFGAEQVWETPQKRNYLFASFNSVEKAKESLGRLHQLEIAHRRLVVEYSFEKEPVLEGKTETEQSSNTTKLIKEFLRALNAWSPSIDFYQPPPPHLNYKYPDVTPEVAINIIHCLFTHKPLYTQALHLMNKMCLNSPFKENSTAFTFFKETFRKFFISDQPPLPPSETESEISSDDTVEKSRPVPTVVRRKRKLPAPFRKIQVMSTPSAPKVKKLNQEEVFEPVSVQELKKPKEISIVVHQHLKPTEEPDLIGELGKFDKPEQPVETEEPVTETEEPVLSKMELIRNRLSYRDMKALAVFKNYHPGEPSMRLYIKNLAKSVTEQDIKRIYKRYVEGMTDEELTGFDVRVMQEGRMKGQAFVTFPNEVIAETALNESNGYLLKDKPMVVQFARAANKKTVE